MTDLERDFMGVPFAFKGVGKKRKSVRERVKSLRGHTKE